MPNAEAYKQAYLAATIGGEEERNILVAWDKYSLWQLNMVNTISEIEAIYFSFPEKGIARKEAERKLFVLRYHRVGLGYLCDICLALIN
ncbi:MAG: hypothetical protein WC453_02635 [Patescibacteria group bacterium]